MMKLVGAALILIASTWIGFELARQFSQRPRQLRQMKTALQSLEAEIMYAHTPLKDAAKKLSKQLPKPINWLFDSFAKKLERTDTNVSEAWDDSLNEIWKWLSLKQGEYEILSQFGVTLGKHDRYQQQKQILLTMTHLEREEQDAIERQGKYEKMVKSLGFLSGLLLIILLV
ncbi:stage III sporulation protein SpoIIIAB [Peribacillus alkalitolerans]|uniref:stage III sporulation protein SpoIIIAB n=1 Tax=Peribacillus alkalitolerans TaxID=1550385 RepID=UPI0013D4DEDE|nr:stage III sporulation protein SpoIIIAB [Peribacillus alkalitolerans]